MHEGGLGAALCVTVFVAKTRYRWDDPLYEQGHLAIIKGNLATEGAVAKISGVRSKRITGPARVFESEEAYLEGKQPDARNLARRHRRIVLAVRVRVKHTRRLIKS